MRVPCPSCKELIEEDANKCPYCHAWLLTARKNKEFFALFNEPATWVVIFGGVVLFILIASIAIK